MSIILKLDIGKIISCFHFSFNKYLSSCYFALNLVNYVLKSLKQYQGQSGMETVTT